MNNIFTKIYPIKEKNVVVGFKFTAPELKDYSIKIHQDLRGLIDCVEGTTCEGDEREDNDSIFLGYSVVVNDNFIKSKVEYDVLYWMLSSKQKYAFLRCIENPYNQKIDSSLLDMIVSLVCNRVQSNFESVFSILRKINKEFENSYDNEFIRVIGYALSENNNKKKCIEYFDTISKYNDETLTLQLLYNYDIPLKNQKWLLQLARKYAHTSYVTKYPDIYLEQLNDYISSVSDCFTIKNIVSDIKNQAKLQEELKDFFKIINFKVKTFIKNADNEKSLQIQKQKIDKEKIEKNAEKLKKKELEKKRCLSIAKTDEKNHLLRLKEATNTIKKINALMNICNFYYWCKDLDEKYAANFIYYCNALFDFLDYDAIKEMYDHNQKMRERMRIRYPGHKTNLDYDFDVFQFKELVDYYIHNNDLNNAKKVSEKALKYYENVNSYSLDIPYLNDRINYFSKILNIN